MPLGRGVAIRLEAPEVGRLRAALSREWDDWLRPQDRQPWRPHVTVQNKVSPAEARDTLARLSAGFALREARAEGLLLWHYRGGPWEAAGRFPFTRG
jgi:2'-5' RNA ligase